MHVSFANSTHATRSRGAFAFRRGCGLALALFAVSAAQAAWSDIKEGLAPKTALQDVGAPLIQSRVRQGSLETWTYDEGGYILFENGRVRYWQAPRTEKAPGPVQPDRLNNAKAVRVTPSKVSDGAKNP